MNKKSKKSGSRTNATSRKASESPMDVGLLEQMIKLMSANDLSTVEVRDGDKRVILKRGVDFVAPSATSGYAPAVSHAPPPSQPHAPGLASGATSAPPADDTAGMTSIKSPMVGTFYSAPSPEAKPFVSLGSRVDEETDVCVIEAMKVFNNIKAECRGVIAKINVSNGETVEFGQILFLVKPS